MAEVKLRAFFFFFVNTFHLRGCAGVAATGSIRAHNCIPLYFLLIQITSRGRPVFRVVSCYGLLCQDNTFVKNQRTSELSFAEPKCADTGTNDSGILQRSLRSVEPVCFLASHRALSHMKPRGSLAANFLTKFITLPEGSADLEILLHFAFWAGRFLFSNNKNVFGIFSIIKMYLKRLPSLRRCALPRCGCGYRSASVAVTQMGEAVLMAAAEELGPHG